MSDLKICVPVCAEDVVESINTPESVEWLGKIFALLNSETQAAVLDEARKFLGNEYAQSMQWAYIAAALTPETKTVMQEALARKYREL